MKRVLFVISGPSGVGKGTLVKSILQKRDDLALSVSCTTRAPRAGERDGKDYFFLTRAAFEERLRENDFLEYDEHFGNYYGTPKSFVLEQLKRKSVILEIDVVGAFNAKRALQEVYPNIVLIMVVPPDMQTLEERLTGRQSETDEERESRLERVKYELSMQKDYNYVLVNDDFDRALSTLENIIHSEINGKEGDKHDQ